MSDCALHVQQKDREVFDRENRVIPNNVIAVSSDTGGFRLGNGVDRWRDLPMFGLEEGEAATDPKSYYSGIMHITYHKDDEFDVSEESTQVMSRVPESDEMVVLGTTGFVIGNGVDSLGELTKINPS